MLEEQKQFADERTSAESFLNILTRDTGALWRHASEARAELSAAPEFAKSDEQFRRDFQSARVTVIRSGHERAANLVTNTWLIKRGCADQLWDVNMLAIVLLAWGLQVNYMYSTEHRLNIVHFL